MTSVPSGPAPVPTEGATPAGSGGRLDRGRAPGRRRRGEPGAPRPDALGPLYRLFLGSLWTRGRLVSLGLLGLVPIAVGIAIGVNDDSAAGRLLSWTRFTSPFGLSLLAPVVALMLASATLGNPSEDGTLVYLWLRPVPRWQLAVGAFAAALTITLPLVTIPLALGAAAAGTGGTGVAATALADALAVVVYTALFTWLGLRVHRPLAWGLAYILIWEGFVANAGAGASKVALRAYTRSVLSQLTDVSLRLSSMSLPVGVIVPLAVAVVAVWATSRRLARTDVA
jgi:ABC-2 type transport system permease protein